VYPRARSRSFRSHLSNQSVECRLCNHGLSNCTCSISISRIRIRNSRILTEPHTIYNRPNQARHELKLKKFKDPLHIREERKRRKRKERGKKKEGGRGGKWREGKEGQGSLTVQSVWANGIVENILCKSSVDGLGFAKKCSKKSTKL
jgi:hypothetical protein